MAQFLHNLTRCTTVSLWILVGTCSTSAQATRPVKVDLATPTATLLTVASAMDHGDTDAYRAAWVATGEDNQRALDLVIEWMLAARELNRAAENRLGKEEADKLATALDSLGLPTSRHAGDGIREMLEMEKPPDTVEGDELLISTFPEIRMRRAGNQWRLVVTHDPQNTRHDVENGVKHMQFVIDVCRKVTRGLDDGRLTTPAQVGSEFMAIMPVATNRSVQPARAPAH
jgi:hypothetical protein